MKILVYGINYLPELIGIGKYTTEMCEWLADQSDEVEVITGMPSYPNWEVFDSYKRRWWFTETIKNVKVHRSPLYVPKQVSGATRILHEISFGISTLIFWTPRLFRRYDVIICIAPPLQLGLAGVIYRMLHKTLFIYHIQDLQLDAAKQLGLIKSKFLLSIVEGLEKIILKRSHFVSTISDGMMRKVNSKGIPADKIVSFRNWIDTSLMAPATPDPGIRSLFGIDSSKKVILYSGNIGEKQGIEIIIEVAEALKESEAFFLIIGDGAFKKKLQDLAQSKRLENIKFFPLQPIELLPGILNIADLHLVLQKKAAADLVMPSKLTAILSVGGAAIVSAEKGTTLFDIVDQNKMGILIEPESALALRIAISENLNKDLNEIRRNARYYAQSYLEKEAIMKQFHSFLTNKA